MNNSRDVIDAGAELIELMLTSAQLDSTSLVGRFREVVFTEHDLVELEVTPSWALVDTLTEQFCGLTGMSHESMPLLQMDARSYDSFGMWAQQVVALIGIQELFTWDWRLAEQHHHEGGIDPIPQGMDALDVWLEPYGFRFMGLDDHSDSYYGFALHKAELQRALELAERADVALYQPSRFLRAELELGVLDANSIRAKKFSRRRKGYDRHEVHAHLASIAERVELQSPTQSFHLDCSGRIENGTAFASALGGYDVEEVNAYIHGLVAQAQRTG